jgi:dienelactone hydrolase
MRGLATRLRRRAPFVWTFALASAAVGALVSAPASAGDGAIAQPPAPGPRGTKVVELDAAEPPIFGAPPASSDAARATFVYLHGVCGLTTNGCGHFAAAPGWLVCPQANATCANGGSSWGGSVEDKIASVDRALDAAHVRWPESARAPVVLVGFSQGAYVAMDIARAQPGRYAGLLLLGADTGGGALSRLRAAGVPRVALVCGAYDMMFPKMRDTPRALAPFGVSARFASLGRVGHTYVGEESDEVLTSMLAWLVEPEA